MASKIYHISNDGKTRPCSTTPEKCPTKGQHFNSLEAAEKFLAQSSPGNMFSGGINGVIKRYTTYNPSPENFFWKPTTVFSENEKRRYLSALQNVVREAPNICLPPDIDSDSVSRKQKKTIHKLRGQSPDGSEIVEVFSLDPQIEFIQSNKGNSFLYVYPSLNGHIPVGLRKNDGFYKNQVIDIVCACYPKKTGSSLSSSKMNVLIKYPKRFFEATGFTVPAWVSPEAEKFNEENAAGT